MNIKDFKPRQTAYLMNFHGRSFDYYTIAIEEVNVVSVGKKYVKIKYPCSSFEGAFYQRDDRDSYLVEKVDCGVANYLFQSRMAANEYIEGKEIFKWINREVQYINENKYNIEQLREIKRILENPKKINYIPR